MISEKSAVSGPMSVETAGRNKNLQQSHRSHIKQQSGTRMNSKDDYKKVAKDMESLFAYQLLKTMREATANLSGENKENGYDTYMSLFDMEVSKRLAERGMGLQDSIINWLERTPEINLESVNENNNNNHD